MKYNKGIQYIFYIRWQKVPIENKIIRMVQSQMYDFISKMLYELAGIKTKELTKEQKQDPQKEIIYDGDIEDLQQYERNFEDMPKEKVDQVINKLKGRLGRLLPRKKRDHIRVFSNTDNKPIYKL
jgi:hypothetical protein